MVMMVVIARGGVVPMVVVIAKIQLRLMLQSYDLDST